MTKPETHKEEEALKNNCLYDSHSPKCIHKEHKHSPHKEVDQNALKRDTQTRQEIKEVEDRDSPYCENCDGCGYIDCDGIVSFLEKHVRGKTDCQYEDCYIDDILELPKEITSAQNTQIDKCIEVVEKTFTLDVVGDIEDTAQNYDIRVAIQNLKQLKTDI